MQAWYVVYASQECNVDTWKGSYFTLTEAEERLRQVKIRYPKARLLVVHAPPPRD